MRATFRGCPFSLLEMCGLFVCPATRLGPLHLRHRGSFARTFAVPLGARFPPLPPFAKINNISAVQSAMCGVQ